MGTLFKLLTVLIIALSSVASAQRLPLVSLRTRCMSYFFEADLAPYENLSSNTLKFRLLYYKATRNSFAQSMIQTIMERRASTLNNPVTHRASIRNQTDIETYALLAFENQKHFRVRQTHARQVSILTLENSQLSAEYLNYIGQTLIQWLQHQEYLIQQKIISPESSFTPLLTLAGSIQLFPEIEKNFSESKVSATRLHSPYARENRSIFKNPKTKELGNSFYLATTNLNEMKNTLSIMAQSGAELNQPVLHISFPNNAKAEEFIKYLVSELYLPVEVPFPILLRAKE